MLALKHLYVLNAFESLFMLRSTTDSLYSVAYTCLSKFCQTSIKKENFRIFLNSQWLWLLFKLLYFPISLRVTVHFVAMLPILHAQV